MSLAPAFVHHPRACSQLDGLLHIFRHLPLRDCMRCRLVSRSWHVAVSEHLRTLTRLTIVARDESQISLDEQPCTEAENGANLMEISFIAIGNDPPQSKMTYERFANILLLFPSIRALTLRNQPFDDIFFALAASFSPQLRQIHLYSCWPQPSMLSASNKRDVFVRLTQSMQTNVHMRHITSLQHFFTCSPQPPQSVSQYCLLTCGFPSLTHLTLANCGLTDQSATAVIRALPWLSYLNIMNNDKIDGACLAHLGEHCETICAGSFNLQVLIVDLLAGLVRSHSARRLRQLELTGCLLGGNLHQLESLANLETLVLHFYCHNYVSQSFESLSQLSHLKRLILQQEYCYEEASVIDHSQLCSIISGCRQLERLEILGEFGWRLRLTNESLECLAVNTRLQQLSISGNSASITDGGIKSLASLKSLRNLQLSSFEQLHDESVEHLLSSLPNLSSLSLKDNRQLSNETLELVVAYALAHPQRCMSVCLDERQFSALRVLWRYGVNYVMDRWLHWWHWWSDTQFDHLVQDWLSDHRKQLANQVINENEALITSGAMPTSTVTVNASKGWLQDERRRWPQNLNVVLHESVRSYKYDINELTPLRFLIILVVSLLILIMMLVTLFVVFVLPTTMSIYFLYTQSIHLLGLLCTATSTVLEHAQVSMLNATLPSTSISELIVDG